MSVIKTYTVTVANPGAGNRYYIDGVLQQTVNLIEGNTYRFDQSDNSNGGHPFKFSTTNNGTHGGGSEYTTGVTINGTPGQAGSYTEIAVAIGAPQLYYYCQYHSGMGGQANTVDSSVLRVFTVTKISTGSGNKYVIDGVQQATVVLAEGGTYRFDQSDSSNSGHPYRFSTTSDGTHGGGSTYTTGVTTNGTPGQAGAYTQITVAVSAPQLYYYCTVHSGMGGAANTVSSNSWGVLKWNQGTWNFQNGNASEISGLQASTAINSVTVNAQINTGWGRSTWNSATWNNAPSATVSITGQQVEVEIDLGVGWGREEWGSGRWNSAGGFVLAGTGNIFSTTGQSLTSSLNSVTSTTGTALITVTGQQINSAVGQVLSDSSVFQPITGITSTTSIGTYAISAGGAITIVVPELEITTSVGTTTTGTANTLQITGQNITTALSNITTGSGNIIPIVGINTNANVSSVVISSSGFFVMSGQEMISALANIIPNSNNNINMTGIQANVIPTDLRFWDPIVDNNTENWTNI